MRDEFLVTGEEYDKAHGFKESVEADGEEYQPFQVEFLRAWEDGTWDTVVRHVPLPMTHEKCTTDHLIEWYDKVYGGNVAHRKMVLVAVYNSYLSI